MIKFDSKFTLENELSQLEEEEEGDGIVVTEDDKRSVKMSNVAKNTLTKDIEDFFAPI